MSAEFEVTAMEPRTFAPFAGVVIDPVGSALSTVKFVTTGEVKRLPAVSAVMTRRS